MDDKSRERFDASAAPLVGVAIIVMAMAVGWAVGVIMSRM